jgi:acetylornithine deacetylase/succinyl-diaminopimelate desuccinylase-like protein
MVAFAAGAALAPVASAQEPSPPGPISPEVERTYQAILAAPVVRKTLSDIKADDAQTFEEQKRLTEIPAPPFKEEARADYFVKRMRQAGLMDAYLDREGNAIGFRKGGGVGPKLVISAHLDTVFPEGTDVRVREKDGRYFAPGIGDDARGLAELLSIIRAMHLNGIRTVGDVVFVGTVGEEALGNMRGVKALFDNHKDIDGFVSLDASVVGTISNKATGSRRYEVIFKGPGGHSFLAFGVVPSAIHAMGRAIAKISDVETPQVPKTTFTVGTVSGGTSVNAIAGEARMAIDMRSNSTEELLKLEQKMTALIKAAVDEENRRWRSEALSVELQLAGARPAGEIPDDAKIVQAARRSLGALGQQVKGLIAASTDSNLPMSLGVPALTIGNGGESGGKHSLAEWYKPVDAYLGAQNAFLLVLALTGVEGVSQPLLDRRVRQ